MAKILRRPRVRSLVTAAAMTAGLVLGTAVPAYADYPSPRYSTPTACNAARPSYVSSWTSPGPCFVAYDYNYYPPRPFWMFIVKTRA
ncbi:hypothetical protein GCM10027290_02960 [Micromonospora sonneratiae]|uniref:Secreted protein n=1 Tax=Micromonospora sonneratiae TaxID=1184706 RepID=A0ABW3Y579_9ACTN